VSTGSTVAVVSDPDRSTTCPKAPNLPPESTKCNRVLVEVVVPVLVLLVLVPLGGRWIEAVEAVESLETVEQLELLAH
jgi:hypothetical protein